MIRRWGWRMQDYTVREREREHARATANYRETFELLGSDISSSLGVGNVR